MATKSGAEEMACVCRARECDLYEHSVIYMCSTLKKSVTGLRNRESEKHREVTACHGGWLQDVTLRALVWYLTAFLVCSFATVMWSTDLDTFCSMLLTMSP